MIVISSRQPKVRAKTIVKPDERIISALWRIDTMAHIHPWTYDDIVSLFREDMGCYVVGLYEKEQLLGFSAVSVVFEDAELWTIGVLPAFQGKGLGRFLLQATLGIACMLQCTQCFLEVRESNERALKLYSSEGFVKTGVRKNYYPASGSVPAENALTMALSLNHERYADLSFDGSFKEFRSLLSVLFNGRKLS